MTSPKQPAEQALQVTDQMNNLENAIKELSSLTVDLESNLISVLTDPPASGETDSSPVQVLVPLASRLRTCSSEIQDLIFQVRNLNNRLQL